MGLFVGIDTSCYTTSVAAMDDSGKLVADLRRILQVTPGERGLQQSAALFQHVQNIPMLITELAAQLDIRQVAGVAASTRPRPVEGSYMPVFTASAGQGKVMAALLGVPLLETSHQEGHLQAGLWSAGVCPQEKSFLAVHVSGGTTELLQVEENQGCTSESLYSVNILGGTSDLHAGQFIDRVGVRLGLAFPCGPKLEELAKDGEEGKGLIPSSVRGYEVSFSGPESHAQRLIDKGTPPALVARAVEACIAKSLVKLISHGLEDTRLREVLVVGGVAANTYLRQELTANLKRLGAKLYFAKPNYSSDNAVGVAAIARKLIGKHE